MRVLFLSLQCSSLLGVFPYLPQNIVRLCACCSVFVSLLLTSCASEYLVKPETLFSIPFGSMPGNFNPWYRGISPSPNAAFTVHNDIFYIGNGNSLSAFSSSGVLLDYIAPAYALSKEQGQVAAYRENSIPYYSYPLEHVGAIGVIENRKLFFANLAVSNTLDSFQTQAPQSAVQLLLYEDKRIKHSIGEDGLNSSNFYSIKKIFTKKNSDVVVYSVEQDAHVLYFFDKNNYFLYKLILSEKQLPLFQNESHVSLTASKAVKVQGLLVGAVPSLTKPYVYVQVRYYDFVAPTGNSFFEVRFHSMKVFRIDIRKQAYDREIPLSEVHESLVLQSITDDESLLFMGSIVPDDKSFAQTMTLLKVNQYGLITQSYELAIPFDDFVSSAVDYDEASKKVGAYYVRDEHVSVLWWRVKHL